MRQLNPFYKNKEWCYILTGSFLITNSLNIDVASKKRLCSTVDLVVSVVRIVLFNIYKIYKRFYIFQGSYNISNLCALPLSKAYIKPTQTSKMELFAESR